MKTYEEYTQYKVGDYVMMNITNIDNKKINDDENITESPGIIVNEYDVDKSFGKYSWDVKLFINDFAQLIPFLKNEVIRKLTQDEIDDIEANIESKKYNI